LGLLCKKFFPYVWVEVLLTRGLEWLIPYKGYELTRYTLIIQVLSLVQSRTSPAFAFDLALNT
jgi:hypothetical protein